MTRKQWSWVLLTVTGTLVIALTFALRQDGSRQNALQQQSSALPQPASTAYIDSSACSSCHAEIARTYSLTGMARSFARLRPDAPSDADTPGGALADFTKRNRVYHKASDRTYTMVERDGRMYQRRHQIGLDGRETNALELEAHYVIGSGNHARTFLHRSADGRLLQMPVTWYAERGGYWAMSPGYDKRAHLEFRRAIDVGCMSCHNGYPRGTVRDDGSGPKFGPASPGGVASSSGAAGDLPEGIDCQRCHGPGQAHVAAIKRGDVAAGVRAIVNPANLDRERQLEACMQCHLESTSSPLPFQVRRYEQPPFSYIPGKPLSDYFIHFDHAPGTPGRDDKFEIAGGAYRLRKSACFQRSEMTCGTCHDPHDIPRGSKAVDRYVAACRSCHDAPHPDGAPRVAGMSAGAMCLDCHMPKRRTDDAVHVVMTDHYIQRRQSRRDLLAERSEADSLADEYRGEVVLYHPPTLPSTPENDLYLAVAQVQQGSNLTSGIPRLEDAIAKHRPARPEFHYELARAYSATGNHEAAIRWFREALRRDANFVPALKELATAAMAGGNLADAAGALERAVELSPADANAVADLGNVYLRQDRRDAAQAAFQRALALEPAMPRTHNMAGLAALKNGSAELAETHLREAIRLQPDLREAHNNLGNLLAGRKAYAEAGYHFEQALASDPNYVEAHHSYGVVLALMRAYPRAMVELAETVRLAPDLMLARLDLADVLAAMGRRQESRVHLEVAARSSDAEVRQAASAALRALEGTRQSP